jgi:hypothetical protein
VTARQWAQGLFTIILQLLLSFGFPAFAAEPLRIVDVNDLRPTQMNVGMLEVDRKAAKLQGLSRRELNEYLRENPVPVVIGPNDRLYLVDHHHLSRAILETQKKVSKKQRQTKVYVTVIADFSQLSKKDFWSEMSARNYTFLKDATGNDIEPTALPKNVGDMGDDFYRSLAGAVKNEGGYTKVKIPFTEFKWAAFFRERIRLQPGNLKTSFALAKRQALELAQSEDARHLPGFRSRCENLFRTPAPMSAPQ